MTVPADPWIPAGEACRRLAVTRSTLYAYVSRGFIRSQASSASFRERVYAADDVERLRRRSEERRAPDKAAAHALEWGLPVLESSIALIDGRRLYYRGLDAVELARSRALEEIASLLWTGRFDSVPPRPVRVSAGAFRPLRFAARAQSMLAAAASDDPLAFDVRPPNVIRTGFRIVHLLAQAAAPGAMRAGAAGERLHVSLARAWNVKRPAEDVLRATLVLCADHELNVSSFTARCVASAGSHPYAVVIAGLAALEGPRHGGAAARVSAMLDSLGRARQLRSALDARMRRGEAIEGFGHPLYPGGDPRAEELLRLIAHARPRSAENRFILDAAAAARDATGDHPNLDFALAAVARVLRLPPGAPLMLFAIGRSVGWIGHAREQYAAGGPIRPRARYVGPSPAIY
jgi:citrate synthase